MRRIIGVRGLSAAVLSIGVLGLLPTATAGAVTGAVTRAFSFIGKANARTATIVNIDSLTINARCDGRGNPVIFAFTSASNADLFGRIFDGLGRIHIVKNSSFSNASKGVALSTSSGDFDATGTILFETSTGKVVTVDYAFDNATTLGRQNVCTVYGSLIAT